MNPKELFLVTYKKKDNALLDTHAREIYIGYRQLV